MSYLSGEGMKCQKCNGHLRREKSVYTIPGDATITLPAGMSFQTDAIAVKGVEEKYECPRCSELSWESAASEKPE